MVYQPHETLWKRKAAIPWLHNLRKYCTCIVETEGSERFHCKETCSAWLNSVFPYHIRDHVQDKDGPSSCSENRGMTQIGDSQQVVEMEMWKGDQIHESHKIHFIDFSKKARLLVDCWLFSRIPNHISHR